MAFGDYVIYVDESGDHSLTHIDPEYPVFVLAFCIFEKNAYVDRIVPALQRFKFEWFGHDMVVLHEREIRKQQPPFVFLKSLDKRERFLAELNRIMNDAPFRIVASVVHKSTLRVKYRTPMSPYDLALVFCMGRAASFLRLQGQLAPTHVICESRGAKEDRDLRAVFDSVREGRHPLIRTGRLPELELGFASKHVNSSGMQLADLVARPIGLHALRPDQPNRAFDVLRPKFGPAGGLKIFP